MIIARGEETFDNEAGRSLLKDWGDSRYRHRPLFCDTGLLRGGLSPDEAKKRESFFDYRLNQKVYEMAIGVRTMNIPFPVLLYFARKLCIIR